MSERKVPHYRIGDALGGGAMGRVYKAEHTLLHRTDALKFLSDELVSNEKAVRRFLAEARMLAGLEHRHICRVYDIGQASDDSWYIAMAYYKGGTLKHMLDDGPLETERALELARQTALGLAYAHDQDIVHRDIKPANLIVTHEETSGEERVKIVDFGVARLLGSTQYTAPGAVVGTFGYLAPEQTRGDEITVAADIWSVGVVLFEMVTGKLPFPGDSHGAQLYAIAHSDPATLPMASSEMDQGCTAIVDRCLQKDPKDRFASAHELAAALGAVLGKDDTVVWPPPPPSPKRWWERVRLQAVVVAAVAVLALVGWKILTGILTEEPDTSGVAVIPFSVMGADEEAAVFGHGLAWYLNDELTAYDDLSDAFWVIPPGALQHYSVADAKEAREQLGGNRTVSGTGRMTGSTIELRIQVIDSRNGERHEREFHDSLANLQTWQRDIVQWVASVLDGQTTFSVHTARRGRTTVPVAFAPYCVGMGYLYPGFDSGSDDVGCALEELSRALEADPSYVRARGEWGFQTWSFYRINDPALAAEGAVAVERAIRLDPSLPRNHFHHGSILKARGDLEGAREAFARGLELESSNAVLQLAMAEVLMGLDRKEDVRTVFERSIAARPGYVSGHQKMAAFHYGYGDLAEAEDLLRRAVNIAPRNPYSYSLLGVTIWAARKDTLAEDYFLESLSIKPNLFALQNLGTYYYYFYRYEDAALIYRQCVEMDPENRSLWHTLAEATRWSPGLEDTSKTIYERAAELGEADLLANPDDLKLAAVVASYHTQLADTTRALELLGRLESADDYSGDAALYAAVAWEDLGRRSLALEYLGCALDKGVNRTMIEDYPGFNNLRSDTRYRDLIESDR